MSDVDWNNLKKLPAALRKGYGAWDCDKNELIAPERECYVFEEIPTMDYPWEGMPTIPPHKDREHLTFFTEKDKRFRVRANPDEDVADVKRRMFDGGMNARANPGTHFETIDDVVLWYAGQTMRDGHKFSEYRVPPGCQAIMAKHKKWMDLKKPPPDDDYWL
eukprot:PRCOL_00001681-RA